MRIGFAGTPEFAHVALTALHQAGHDIVVVLTQPDRPSGRGMKLLPSAVKHTALALNLPVWQPNSLRDEQTQVQLKFFDLDLLVVAAYGQILPPSVLCIPKHGCLNIHASLLPRWRGAAPIHRAIAAGDTQTGITIMQMDAGLDTGAICLQQALAIGPADTMGSIHDALAELGGVMIVNALDLIKSGKLTTQAQAEHGLTYAAKVSRHEAQINFHLPAEEIARTIRAFNPSPGAWLTWEDKTMKIWRATVLAETGKPGYVLRADDQGIVVSCGQAALCIQELQVAGGKKQTAAQFLAGHAAPSNFPPSAI